MKPSSTSNHVESSLNSSPLLLHLLSFLTLLPLPSANLVASEAIPIAKMADFFSLKDHTAVVTGGTRGIGQAVAIGLAEAGADIILVQVRI